MFRGHVFVAASDVPQDVRALLLACGGRVVSKLVASVTFGLVSVASLRELEGSLSCEGELRGLRIPIVRTSWVRASVAVGYMIPVKYPHAVYDPVLFESLHFTTAMLPTSLEVNVVAVMQFLGGTYSLQLSSTTNVIVCGDSLSHCEGDSATEMAAVDSRGSALCRSAMECAIPCVSVEWLRDCIITQRLLPLPGPPRTDVCVDLNSTVPVAAAAVEGDREERSWVIAGCRY